MQCRQCRYSGMRRSRGKNSFSLTLTPERHVPIACPDWDLSTPGLREAWDAGDHSRFHGWDRKASEPAAPA